VKCVSSVANNKKADADTLNYLGSFNGVEKSPGLWGWVRIFPDVMILYGTKVLYCIPYAFTQFPGKEKERLEDEENVHT
jgi:hypothetical protein